jgi:enterochelin esterase-like enzyme
VLKQLRGVCAALLVCALAAWGASSSASEIRRATVPSVALGRDMRFTVYVPDGYETGGQRYPVLYLLHGAGGDENSWIERGSIQAHADRLIGENAIPPSLIVMPGCRACWWIDGAKDKAETAFWSELVPAVTERFRTIETRDGRLVAGLSAGGYGTVRFAMKYPDRIAAVAAFSPAIYAVTPPANSSARTQPPFIGPDGQFNQIAWTALNYPALIDHYFQQPSRVPFYLVSGDNDRFGIAFETALLFKSLFEKQPEAAELRIVDGDHNWAVWANALDGALTYLYRFAARPQPAAPSAPASGDIVSVHPR